MPLESIFAELKSPSIPRLPFDWIAGLMEHREHDDPTGANAVIDAVRKSFNRGLAVIAMDCGISFWVRRDDVESRFNLGHQRSAQNRIAGD